MKNTNKDVMVFKALAHPVRLEIVKRLAHSEACVCEIVEWFDLDRTTISKHISLLKSSGLLYDRKEGQKIYYGVALLCLMPIIKCLENSFDEKKCSSCCERIKNNSRREAII